MNIKEKKKNHIAAPQSVNSVIKNQRICNWSVKPKNHRGSWKWFEFQNTITISMICYVEENVYYEG